MFTCGFFNTKMVGVEPQRNGFIDNQPPYKALLAERLHNFFSTYYGFFSATEIAVQTIPHDDKF